MSLKTIPRCTSIVLGWCLLVGVCIWTAGCTEVKLVHCFDTNDCPGAASCQEGRCITNGGIVKRESPHQLSCQLSRKHTFGLLGDIVAFALSPSRPWLAILNSNGVLTLWDKEKMDIIARTKHQFPRELARNFINMVFHPTEPKLYVGPNFLSTIQEYEFEPKEGKQGEYEAKAQNIFAPDNGETARGSGGTPKQIAITPNGKWIASAVHRRDPEGEHHVLIIQSEAKQANGGGFSEDAFTIKAHKEEVYHLVASPDNRWLLTTSKDNTLKLWAISFDKGKVRLALHKTMPYDTPTNKPSINANGRYLALQGHKETSIYRFPSMELLEKERETSFAAFGKEPYQIYLLRYDVQLGLWDASTLAKGYWSPTLTAKNNAKLYTERTKNLLKEHTIDPQNGTLYAHGMTANNLVQWLPKKDKKHIQLKRLTKKFDFKIIHPTKPIAFTSQQHFSSNALSDSQLVSLQTREVLGHFPRSQNPPKDLETTLFGMRAIFLEGGKRLLQLVKYSGYNSERTTKYNSILARMWRIEEIDQRYKITLEKEVMLDRYVLRDFDQIVWLPKKKKIIFTSGKQSDQEQSFHLVVLDAAPDAKGVPRLTIEQEFPLHRTKHNNDHLADIKNRLFFFHNSLRVHTDETRLIAAAEQNQNKYRFHTWKLDTDAKGKLLLIPETPTAWVSQQLAWRSSGFNIEHTGRWAAQFNRKNLLMHDLHSKTRVPVRIDIQDYLNTTEVSISAPLFYPKGGWLALATADESLQGKMYLWNLRTNTPGLTFPSGHSLGFENSAEIAFQDTSTGTQKATRLIYVTEYESRIWNCSEGNP